MAGTSKHPHVRRSVRFLLPLFAALLVIAAGALVVRAATTTKPEANAARNVKNSYQFKASVPGPLAPGRTLPVKIQLANNKSYPVWIYHMKISALVDGVHRAAGCDAAQNYSFTQLPKQSFPFQLKKRRFRVVKVRSKGKVRKKKLAVFTTLPTKITKGQPLMTMADLPNVNQDACKGATIFFRFDSRADSSKKKAKKLAKKEKP